MSTSTLAAVRVEPALRNDAEAVLDEGESFSDFVARCVRDGVAWRRTQDALLARARDAVERSEREGNARNSVAGVLTVLLPQGRPRLEEQPVMRPGQGVGFYRTCGGRPGALAKARRRRLGWKGHELHADSALVPAADPGR
jgi:hypothetical protein